MTSSNGNIIRVTGPLCGEFTGPGEFPAQRPVTRSFGVFFHLRLNKRLSKQPWGWWFETAGRSLWRHRNDYTVSVLRTITPSVKSSVTTTLLGVEGVCTAVTKGLPESIAGETFEVFTRFKPNLVCPLGWSVNGAYHLQSKKMIHYKLHLIV